MNSKLIRDRLNADTSRFVLCLSDGSRLPVAHPDFVAVSPGQVVVINPKTEGLDRVDPLHVVAIEERGTRSSRANGKRGR